MAITATALLVAKPGEVDNLIAIMSKFVPELRAWEGSLGTTSHRDQDDPNKILLIERWEAKENHLSYLKMRADNGDLDRLGKLVAAPPAFAWYDDADL
ncbi:MAG: putative quinol monooxygenase [Sporichthyaceae bacterium]